MIYPFVFVVHLSAISSDKEYEHDISVGTLSGQYFCKLASEITFVKYLVVLFFLLDAVIPYKSQHALIVAAVVPGSHLESPPSSGGVPSDQGENIPIPHPAFETAACAKVGSLTDGL